MRSSLIIVFTSVLLLCGCASQGTVVRKHLRPLPFSESLGIGAIYDFDLRDRSGQIHCQMVTPQVFASYEVGDYFNDLTGPPPARSSKEGPRSAPELEPMLPLVPRHGPTERFRTPYQPVRTTSITHDAGKIAGRSLGESKSARTASSKTRRSLERTARKRKSAKVRIAAKKKHRQHSTRTAGTTKHKKHREKIAHSHSARQSDQA